MPQEWFEAFLLRWLTIQWTSFSNHKALLSNAGQKCEVYPDYTPFTNDELRKHIGMYMVHGLAPSPQVSMQFTWVPTLTSTCLLIYRYLFSKLPCLLVYWFYPLQERLYLPISFRWICWGQLDRELCSK